MDHKYTIRHHQVAASGCGVKLQLQSGKNYYLILWHGSTPYGDLYIHRFDGNATSVMQEIQKKTIGFLKREIKRDDTTIHYYEEYKSVALKHITPFLLVTNTTEKQRNCHPKIQMSVIICTRNRSSHLQKCLQSLLTQEYIPEEIIVVDNAPNDNSTQLVVEGYKEIRYVKEPTPGLDFARNAGAQAAVNEVIAYVDDDVIVHPMWSLQVYKCFNDSNIGAMTGLILPATLDHLSQQIFESYWSFNKGFDSKIFTPTFLAKKQAPRVWQIGAGANMAFRKSVMQKVNYFDERLDAGAAGCNGDSEIWYRVLSAGFSIHYNPQSIVFHEHRQQMSELKNQLFNYIKGHVVAALIQNRQNKSLGYRNYVTGLLPGYYLMLLRLGFPSYSGRYQTLAVEIKGYLHGILYYIKHRNTPSINK